MNRALKPAFRILRLLLVSYAVALALVYFFQEKLLFHPSVLPVEHRFGLKLRFEERLLNVKGHELHSLLVHPPATARGLLLFFHGNAGDLSNWGLVAEELAERTGFEVLIMDYPGFGKSGGTVRGEEQLHEIARAFFELARKEAKGPLVIYGRSIGSGLAVRLAADHSLSGPVSGLVLESPYLSVRSLAAELFPWLPVSLLLRYPMRSDEWMPKVSAPTLFLHGTRDSVIPIESGRALYGLSTKARFLEVEGAGHNNLSDFGEYWSELSSFLRKLRENP